MRLTRDAKQGCEYLKAIAMSGLGTKGAVHITDDDRIELSNLRFVRAKQSVNCAQVAYLWLEL